MKYNADTSKRQYFGQFRERSPWVKPGGILISLYMIVSSYLSGAYIYIILGILMLIAVFFKKEQVISEEGIELRYYFLGRRHDNTWSWGEVTSIHSDYDAAPPHVGLHIGKDIVTRTYFLTAEDAEEVKAMAKEMNPKIVIEDMPAKDAVPKRTSAPKKKKKK